MLSLFRLNDPYRLVLIFAFLLAVRLPFIIAGIPLSHAELNWILVGERLATGDWVMYRDVWQNTGPLAAVVYKWLYMVFGRQTIGYQIVALIVVFFQCRLFNSLLLRNKAYDEYTYVPAFLFALFSSFFQEMFLLSPPLMGLWFFLLALNNVFKRIDSQTRDEMFLYSGVYLGIAALFYLPFVYFFLICFVSLMLFSSAIPRRLFLLVHGFLFVLTASGIIAYLNDAFQEWWTFYIASWWTIDQPLALGIQPMLLLLLIPGSILLLAIFKTYAMGRYVVYQVKFQQVFLFMLTGAVLNYFFADHYSPYQLMLFVPVIAFFCAHYLLALRKRWQAEVILLLLLFFTITNNMAVRNNWFYIDQFISLERLYVDQSVSASLPESGSLLVLGPTTDYYARSKVATPFINWDLSKPVLTDLNSFENIEIVNQSFMTDLPDLIVDESGLMPAIFKRIPRIATRYQKKYGKLNLYVKKDASN